jgi:ankyrin repeat protein
MKTKLVFALVLLTSATLLAATNDLTSLLQQGLLDEEATHDLHAAITDYQAVAAQFDKDREIAATAVYRLGECYRKLGQTNEAVAQYQRIVREFPAQTTLVTLSRQNLTGLGLAPENTPSTPAAASATVAALEAEQALLQDQIQLAALQLDATQKQAAAGIVPQNEVSAQKEKLLQLQQHLAELQEKQAAGPLTLPVIVDTESQKIEELKSMFKNSPDLVNSAGSGGEPPLVEAARNDQMRVATFLLDNKGDVNLGRGHGTTPLIAAAENGHKAMAELLLSRGADVNAHGQSGETALHTAALRGFVAVAEVLLAHHADVEATDVMGKTALSYAVVNDSPELIKLLLANKADPNGGTFDRPLLAAVKQKEIDAATTLLQAGADPNLASRIDNLPDLTGAIPDFIVNQKPVSPLFLAIYLKQPAMVELLLRNKADPNVPQSDGAPLIFNALNDAGILGDLLDAGAKVDVVEGYPYGSRVTSYGLTPLSEAAQHGYADSVKLLLKHGANPNGRPTAEEAYSVPGKVTYSQQEMQLRRRASEGPLYWAAVSLGGTNVTNLLLDAGADPNVRDANSDTPLDVLKRRLGQNGSPAERDTVEAMIDCLREHGALDDPPDPNVISVSRASANYSAHILQKGTNDPNHFTLLEVVAMNLKFLAPNPGAPRENDSIEVFWQQVPLQFPDLAHLHIRHPSADLKSWSEQIFDLSPCLKTGDTSKDVAVEWGDVIEIPEADHPRTEKWPGFSIPELANFKNCLERHINIIVNGKTNLVTLVPEIDFNPRTVLPGQSAASILTETPYWLKPVLLNSKVVLASSDLSRVRVTRRDPETGKTREWVFDCSDTSSSTSRAMGGGFGGGGGGIAGGGSGNGGGGFAGGGRLGGGGGTGGGGDPRRGGVSGRRGPVGGLSETPVNTDFWLRDGDVIEIPEKP